MPSPFAELPPLLDNVRIASPCSAIWEEMIGDQKTRFCSHCKLHVYNLSAMGQDDAQQLLKQRSNQQLCVRFYRRADGTVLTSDCPVGILAIRRRFWRGVAMAAAAFLSLASGSTFASSFWKPKWLVYSAKPVPTKCQPARTVISAEASVVMGNVAVPPPKPAGWSMGGCPAP